MACAAFCGCADNPTTDRPVTVYTDVPGEYVVHRLPESLFSNELSSVGIMIVKEESSKTPKGVFVSLDDDFSLQQKVKLVKTKVYVQKDSTSIEVYSVRYSIEPEEE